MKFLNRILLITSFIIPYAVVGQAPTEQDCLGATVVCQNTFSVPTINTGSGTIAAEVPISSCHLLGEIRSYWFRIFIQISGDLCFTITPLQTDDYDWSVYNMTNAVCSDVPSMTPVSCNGFTPLTLVGETTGPNGQGGGGDEPCIPVLVGESYVICVTNKSASVNGFDIDFSASTASITDNTAPSIVSSSSLTCGDTSITFSFSEQVLCSTVQASDFQLIPPSGSYSLSNLIGPTCIADSTTDSVFTLTISPAITGGGTYNLCLTGGSGITDPCDNTASGCFTIIGSGLDVLPGTVNDVLCFDGNDGSANVTVSGGVAPYTYTWSTNPQQTTATATGLAAGNYAVTVEDTGGCSGSAVISISGPSVGVVPEIISCDGVCDGNALATVTGGTGPFTYNWWNTTFDTLQGPSGISVSGLCAKAYYLVTFDGGTGCADTTLFQILEPLISVASITTSCLDTCDGGAVVTLIQTDGPYLFQWYDSLGIPMADTDSILDGFICPGQYSVEVTAQGTSPACVKTSSVTVTEPLAISGSITTYKDACFGQCDGFATMGLSGGTPPYVYNWSAGGQTGATATGLCAGNYSVTCTDSEGCPSVTDNVQLDTNPELISSTTVIHTSCDTVDGQTTVLVTGGTPPYTYQWDDPGNSTTASIINLSVGEFTVIITDSSDCKDTAYSSLGYIDSNIATISVVSPITCQDSCDGALTISVTGGVPPYQYSWSIVDTSSVISGLCADTVYASTFDSTGCPGYATFILTEPEPITSSITGTDETTCYDSTGTINLTPAGGNPSYSYAWSNGETTEDLSNLGFGTYSVTISDANNCPEDITSFTLLDQPRIAIDLAGTDITCFGFTDGAVDLTVLSGGAGPYTYSWSELSQTQDISGLAAGSYSVSITDTNNCPETTESITLTEPDLIITSLSSQCLNGFGYIYSSTSGGTSTYTYAWSNGSTSANLSNLSPGIFLVTVTDGFGCPPAEEEIEFVPCTIKIPNAFTPNDNGVNDLWNIQKLAYYPDCRVKVYNRWGDVVFSSKGYDDPWDGKHRLTSVDLPSAVYYYVIENVNPEFVEEGSVLHGYVTIVR